MGHDWTGQTSDGLLDHPDNGFELAPPQPALPWRGVLKIPEELDDVPQVKVYCGYFLALCHELSSVSVKRNTAI